MQLALSMLNQEYRICDNADTPCALENLALLTCAHAHVHLAEDVEARRLEKLVADLGKQGHGPRAGIDLEILIARGDMTRVEQTLDAWSPAGLNDVEGLIARLDGLVALERRADIESDAPALVGPDPDDTIDGPHPSCGSAPRTATSSISHRRTRPRSCRSR